MTRCRYGTGTIDVFLCVPMLMPCILLGNAGDSDHGGSEVVAASAAAVAAVDAVARQKSTGPTVVAERERAVKVLFDMHQWACSGSGPGPGTPSFRLPLGHRAAS